MNSKTRICVQVLVTHGPPLGHGDLCDSGQRAGCLDLLQAIQVSLRPRRGARHGRFRSAPRAAQRQGAGPAGQAPDPYHPGTRRRQGRVRPAYHVFGHIHEGHGVTTDGVTTYVNACTCDARYRPTQPPIVFDVDPAALRRRRAGLPQPPAAPRPAAAGS